MTRRTSPVLPDGELRAQVEEVALDAGQHVGPSRKGRA